MDMTGNPWKFSKQSDRILKFQYFLTESYYEQEEKHHFWGYLSIDTPGNLIYLGLTTSFTITGMKNNSTSAEHLQVSNEAVMVVDEKSGISIENIDSHSVGHQVEDPPGGHHRSGKLLFPARTCLFHI